MKYKQLELFDLSLYTSESTPEVDWKESQVEETSVCVQYEQLELDLFPQPSHKTIIEFVRLAA